MSWTKGPWRWLKNPIYKKYGERPLEEYSGWSVCDLPKLVAAEGMEICNFGNDAQYYPTEGTPPKEADARLIAKAPELAELLREAVGKMDYEFCLADTKENPDLFEFWYYRAMRILVEIEGKSSGGES